MAVVALLSTAGCTNACLYASGNLTEQLAKAGLFPQIFGEKSRLGRHAGLLITTALVLIVANVVDLSAIASVGSAVSLVVFLLVALAGWRRREDTNSNPFIVALAFIVIAVVLGFFAVDTIQTAPRPSPRSSCSECSRSSSTPWFDVASAAIRRSGRPKHAQRRPPAG